MGYLRPTAIIVTGSYSAKCGGGGDVHWAEIAQRKAYEIFAAHGFGDLVTDLTSGINDARSFLVAWDGSKEGWSDSDEGDTARDKFVAWLRTQAYSDGSSPLDWVEIQYGGDDREAIVLRHGDEVEVNDAA